MVMGLSGRSALFKVLAPETTKTFLAIFGNLKKVDHFSLV